MTSYALFLSPTLPSYPSAYRISRTRIAIIGMTALAIHGKQRLTSCEWHALDGSIVNGRLEIDYMGEHHDYLVRLFGGDY